MVVIMLMTKLSAVMYYVLSDFGVTLNHETKQVRNSFIHTILSCPLHVALTL